MHDYDRTAGERRSYSPLGQFRVDNPEQAPKLFQEVKDAYEAYVRILNTNREKLEKVSREYVFARQALTKAVEGWGKVPPKQTTPDLYALQEQMRLTDEQLRALLKKLQAYKGANEFVYGPMRVRR